MDRAARGNLAVFLLIVGTVCYAAAVLYATVSTAGAAFLFLTAR